MEMWRKIVKIKFKLYFNLRAKFSFYIYYRGGGRTYGGAERAL